MIRLLTVKVHDPGTYCRSQHSRIGQCPFLDVRRQECHLGHKPDNNYGGLVRPESCKASARAGGKIPVGKLTALEVIRDKARSQVNLEFEHLDAQWVLDIIEHNENGDK